jgi:hypothetical protein
VVDLKVCWLALPTKWRNLYGDFVAVSVDTAPGLVFVWMGVLLSNSNFQFVESIIVRCCGDFLPSFKLHQTPFLSTVEEFVTTLSGMIFIFVKDGVVTYSNVFFTHSCTVFNFFKLGVSALSYLPCFDNFLYGSTTNIFARCDDDDGSMMMMSVL